LLLLKLLLVPAFLAIISLAGRRWGAGIAGWLAGFPVVAGPILFFLTLERGANFGASASVASLSAVFASVAFNVVYSHVCLRYRWLPSLATALCAWCAAALLLTWLPSSAFVSLLVACATLLFAPRLFPRPEAGDTTGTSTPMYELFLRMFAAGALTVLVTGLAVFLGQTWSGLLAVFPVLGSVLAVFSQRIHGPAYVAQLLRAMVTGLYSFAAFCFALAVSLPHLGNTVSFAVSAVAAIVMQYATRTYLTRRSSGPTKAAPLSAAEL
jgi:hypothetical protein